MEIRKINAEDTWALRHTVMWPDKPLDYVILKDDDKGLHFGVYVDNELISVISLFINNRKAQFRKFATRTDKQGQGYGSLLLKFIIEKALPAEVDSLWCNARESKSDFYERFGMQKTNVNFINDDVPYVVMEKKIIHP